MRVAPAIELSSAARAELEKLMRRRTTSLRVAERCRIVMLASEGLQDKQIGELIHVAPRMAALWRSRFIELGVDDVFDPLAKPWQVWQGLEDNFSSLNIIFVQIKMLLAVEPNANLGTAHG
jgi:hypothetical protein